MAPRRGESIENDDEHQDFFKQLVAYHEKRGTTLDLEPKIGNRHVDLLNLYNRVVEEGGYDLCSDTKAKPLMWRKFAEEFIGKNPYTAAQAFQIKNIYYKNLCAYEISNHWHKEPPPKEILEDVTAKGGNVMERTLDNFLRPSPREPDKLTNGDESLSQLSPKDEKMDGSDETGGSAGARTSRGLRQQPPQRVLFQPDMQPGRQSRPQMPPMHTGGMLTHPSMNGPMSTSILVNGASSTLASYEPSQSYPLSLKPVMTPANNPEFYALERKRKAESNAGPLAKKYRHIMLPGTGFIGPNIYIRAQLALQSGIPSEEQYGLHHLVKISYERGDKYRFDQFPGLAEVLIKKILKVTSLFYDVEWNVEFDEDIDHDDEVLDGLHGTSNIIDKLLSRMPLVTNDTLHDEFFVSELSRIIDASLVLRNMSLQPENGQYLARNPLTRDCLAITLNLPQHESLVELRNHILDTAEQVLVWCDLSPHDALYHSLLNQLESDDRGTLVAALKTIPRIGMHLAAPKKLTGISSRLLNKVKDWLMLDDEELRSACLDFLFQYTAFSDNVDALLQTIDAEALTRHLSRLLLFAAKEHKESRTSARPEEAPSTGGVPRLARSLVENLLKLDEPERSSEWLRMCFLPEPNSEMTQISLWQAYQGAFGPFQKTHPHMIAGDFIKNVSSTFQGATAQVAGHNKYVIRGIKARTVPISTGILSGSRPSDKGRELDKCRWKVLVPVEPVRDPVTGEAFPPTTVEKECPEWFRHSSDMLLHILKDHLKLPEKPSSEDTADMMDIDPSLSSAFEKSSNTLRDHFNFSQADSTTYRCKWTICNRSSKEFDSHKASPTALFARHIQTHLPNTEAPRPKPDPNANPKSPLVGGERISFITMTDEKGEAAGVPMSAALVLRNIAKFLPKDVPKSQEEEIKAVMTGQKLTSKDADGSLVARIFDDEVKERLFFAVAYSKTMQHPAGNVLRAISKHPA